MTNIFKISTVIDNIVKPNFSLQKILEISNKVSLLEQKLLDNYHWNKEHLFIVIANDNSMYPIIRDKTEGMADNLQTNIESNKIYVIKIKSDIYIRKLIKTPIEELVLFV